MVHWQVKGQKMSHEVDPKNALLQCFSSIHKDETVVNLTDSVSVMLLLGARLSIHDLIDHGLLKLLILHA